MWNGLSGSSANLQQFLSRTSASRATLGTDDDERPTVQRISGWRRRQPDAGFTLIELLVVIIILGVLSSVVVFAVRGAGDKGADAAYATDAKTIRTAQEAFCAQNGRYASEQELVDEKFLSEDSEYHFTNFAPSGDTTAFGRCEGAGELDKSKFTITCNVAESGCGGGGALATGGTLVVGESFGIPTTNPAVSTSGAVHAYWEIMYNGLIALDGAGNPVPELATTVPTEANGGVTDGGRTYTFQLRNDVFWHDDDPAGTRRQFTSADVKFTFEKALLVHHGRTRNVAPFLQSWDPITQVASIDATLPFEVTFNFTDPYAPLLKQLNVTEAPILPAHRYTGNPTLAVLNANVIGTGPFKCADPAAATPCRSGSDAKVVKNPAYFRTGLPILDEIIMRPLADPTTRKNALRDGDVDWLWDVPEQFVSEIQGNSALMTASTQSLGGGANSIDTFIFNNTAPGDRRGQLGGPDPTGTPDFHPILGDVNVRKAIFHAINRPQVLAARFGVGKVAIAPISSELPQHATDIDFPALDTGAADALLDAAGWGGPRTTVGPNSNIRTALNHPREGLDPRVDDGDPLTIDFIIGSTAFDARMAVIDANLAAVGIDLNRLPVDANATNKVFIDRTFDTHIINLAQGYDPQIGIRRSYHSDQVAAVTFTNAAGYKNAVVDDAFDDGVRTLDPAARFALYHQFQVQVAQDLPMVPLIETPNVRGFDALCTGFKEYTGLFAESASCRR